MSTSSAAYCMPSAANARIAAASAATATRRPRYARRTPRSSVYPKVYPRTGKSSSYRPAIS
ncbi:Uncharacterised protein [Mycobacteroides abscessus]|nr:Uncharacterised protein [Mycobacteroides abscessus]